jgi:hypothetical protein
MELWCWPECCDLAFKARTSTHNRNLGRQLASAPVRRLRTGLTANKPREITRETTGNMFRASIGIPLESKGLTPGYLSLTKWVSTALLHRFTSAMILTALCVGLVRRCAMSSLEANLPIAVFWGYHLPPTMRHTGAEDARDSAQLRSSGSEGGGANSRVALSDRWRRGRRRHVV